jgi:hypothetical protein
MVEDVTDSFEFFVKELLDLKIYDILAISGYKARSWSIDTMIKLSLHDFVEQAKKSGKFDPKWTVERVKMGRKKIVSSHKTEKKDISPATIEKNNITNEDIIEQDSENTT